MTRTPHATDARAAWVVVADHGRARLFIAPQSTGPLQELEALLNPVAGQRESELVSDRPGRIVKGRGGSSRGVGEEQTHKAHAADQFAKAVCTRLAKARNAGELSRLYLIAEPHFLGLLRQHMEPPTAALIAEEIDKDLTQRSAEDLRGLLPRQL